MSHFENILLAPSDPIFGIGALYKSDPRSFKINLIAGVYKTKDLNTPVLRSVKLIEEKILAKEDNKEYLLIEGDQSYLYEVGKWILGKKTYEEKSKNISAFQTIGGTGALRIGAEFLHKEIGSTIHISDPSWPNHLGVFSQAGMKVCSYPYYDVKNNSFDFDGMRLYLETLPENSIVLFHTCCHNPSGADPSNSQWIEFAEICKKRRLIPFFDTAYLGFGNGVEEDAFPIRLFMEMDIEMLIAVSFSKNFSLYGERIGALFIISSSHEIAQKVSSQVKFLIRRNYSNPPLHGMKIVHGILSDLQLKQIWEDELLEMRARIQQVKLQFSSELERFIKKRDYSYLKNTHGMFCYCGLEKSSVERLMKEFAIYMTYDGRINVAGLTSETIGYVIESIDKVLD